MLLRRSACSITEPPVFGMCKYVAFIDQTCHQRSARYGQSPSSVVLAAMWSPLQQRPTRRSYASIRYIRDPPRATTIATTIATTKSWERAPARLKTGCKCKFRC